MLISDGSDELMDIRLPQTVSHPILNSMNILWMNFWETLVRDIAWRILQIRG